MPLLETEGVTVQFGGLMALSEVKLWAEAGQITGIIGPNGAGKSTMLGVLSGLIRPKKGHVQLDGRNITRLAPNKRAKLGMARTFQRLELWTSMSVYENVLAAAEFSSKRGQDKSPADVAKESIEKLELTPLSSRPVEELSSGQGRLLEVARAIATSPKLLLLDEPSAGLNEAETRELGVTLASLAAGGMGIVMVEHHIELVSDTCSNVFVLNFGEILEHGSPSEIRRSEAVQTAYLGSRHSVTSS